MSSTPPLVASASSPPSSPPDVFPWEQKDPTSTSTPPDAPQQQNVGPFKNVFSILGKRKPTSPRSDNARPPKASRASHDGLQQMQMSLGQKVQKKCVTCGMEYIASAAEDRKLHDKYHTQNVDGYDLGKDFVAKIRTDGRKWAVFQGVRAGDAIVYLDCFDNHHRKKKGQAVLDIVQRELGAVAIPEPEIWDLRHSGHDVLAAEPRYKSYLYVRGTKCVGYLLVKSIEEAREVVKARELGKKTGEKGNDLGKKTGEKANDLGNKTGKKGNDLGNKTGKKLTALEKLNARKQEAIEAAKALQDEMAQAAAHPIRLDDTTHSAVMGISRIWTSSSCRGQGIAHCLLNTAVNRNNSMIAVDEQSKTNALAQNTAGATWSAENVCGKIRKIERKQDVAFSQPTEAGAKLARKWFGRAYGWRVYLD